MKYPIRAWSAVLLVLGLAAAAGAQDNVQYRNFASLTASIQGLAKAHPQLVKVESIGRTRGGRDLWAIQIASPGGPPAGERPALLVVAGLDGDHLIGGELALFLAEHLVKNADRPEVKARLDAFTFYIIPRLSPDAAEAFWAPVRWARRTNATPFDDDNDGLIDEDGPDDLNQDGIITVMRVKDPNGVYIADPEDKRLMRRADPKKGERGEYALYSEGIDNDGDGFINEDGPGGVNINRNFMHEYPFYKPEAGRYMVSEAETKALMTWLVKHRAVAAILAFGENDNLITPPNTQGRYGTARAIDLNTFADASIAGASKTGMIPAGGLAALFGRGGRGGGGGGGGEETMISGEMIQMLMASGGGPGGPGGPGGQPSGASAAGGRSNLPGRAAALVFNAADVEYFRLVSNKYAELTKIRTAPVLSKPEGAFFQVGYFQFGVPSFSTPGWGLPEAPRGQRGPGMGAAGAPETGGPPAGAGPGSGQMNASPMAGMMTQRGGAAGAGAGEAESTAVDKSLLQWMDKEKIDGFLAWTPVKHPDLGEVEIGGFKPYAAVNPPAARVAELGLSHAEFALYLTSLFPKVAVAKLEAAAQGGGLYRVKAEVENSGFWPTAMAHAVAARAVRPTMVQLQVAPETILSGNTKTSFIQSLAGSGGRQKYDWLIRAQAGDTLTLKVVSQKAGTDLKSVTLK
jgi:hypothetical protein